MGLAPIRGFAELEQEWGAAARADVEARRNGPQGRPDNDAADTARPLEAQRIAARDGYAAREAAEALLRQYADASLGPSLVNAGAGAHRARQLVAKGTPESLPTCVRQLLPAKRR
jgi:hypothetical protein